MYTKNPEWPKHEVIYDKCMALAKSNPGHSATQWIHLSDAVEGKTISPMEAYDAINLGYVPENLKIRKSRYCHLL
jgi:hypothetical protein